MDKSNGEPGFLQRLRRAVEQSGLVVDMAAVDLPAQHFPVWSDLAQIALEALHLSTPQVGASAAEELQTLASPAEYDLLIQGRGYTYLHVVHFLYEFAKHYDQRTDSRYFGARVGEAGGGLQAETNPDLLALIRLLATALPEGEDSENLSQMAVALGELFLDKVFPSGLFRLTFTADGVGALAASLQYADPEAVKAVGKWQLERIKVHGPSQAWHKYGTPALLGPLNASGLLPTNNWRNSVFEGADKIDGEAMLNTII